METEKLTIATTPDEVRSLAEIFRQPQDWDGGSSLLQEIARKVHGTFTDGSNVQFIDPESGKPKKWAELNRVADPGTPGDKNHSRDVAEESKRFDPTGALRAVVYPGTENETGIPWGSTGQNTKRGYIQVLTMTSLLSMIPIGPEKGWENTLGTIRSWQHPFTDMVITDQYLMSKSDEYLSVLLPEIIDSLRAPDQTTVPKATLIESTKPYDDDPRGRSPGEIATEDVSRLNRLYPEAEWSVICVDLRWKPQETGKTQKKNVSDFLHGRFLTTTALQIQFDPGLDILKPRRSGETTVVSRDRNGQPILKSGRINVAATFEQSGLKVIVDYVSRLRFFYNRVFRSAKSVGLAGNVDENRLLYNPDHTASNL